MLVGGATPTAALRLALTLPCAALLADISHVRRRKTTAPHRFMKYPGYAGQHGRALMDRELYLPKEWADDGERRQATKIPKHIEFKTKPQLAQQMIERTVAAKVPFAWIAGDEVYGDNRSLRVWLEQHDLHFVLAVRSNQYVWTERMRQETVEELGKTITRKDWHTLSAGEGTKGPRWYDWARVPLLSWQMPCERWLLLHRSRADGKPAFMCAMRRRIRTCKRWCR